MGRPDEDAESTQQTEYELQPQEYDPTPDPTSNLHDDQYYQQDQQQQFQPQPQQPPPPPPNQAYPQPPLPQQQQQQQFQPQPQQYPQQQQPNQAYPPPQRPAPYPPQNVQYNIPAYPNGSNQQPAAAYPPHPVQFPPRSPATNQMYANVGPQPMQSQIGYAPNASPQPFPQQQFMPPQSPHKPGAVAGIPVGPGGVNGWRSGLFDFMDDPMNALVTAFFPCLTFGQIAEIVDDGHTTCGTSGMLYGGIAFCIGLPCLMSCTYRTKLRNKFGLPEAPAPDWITHFLCEWCALCQEYRELQHRGWDPSIGWQGNMARNQVQQPAMMAPVNQRMMG